MQEYHFMRAAIESDPKASESEHKARFWAAIQKAPKKERDAVLRSLADAYLGQRRSAVLRSLEPTIDRAERRKREREEDDRAVANGIAKFHAIVEEKARALAAEMVALRA